MEYIVDAEEDTESIRHAFIGLADWIHFKIIGYFYNEFGGFFPKWRSGFYWAL